MKQVNTQEFDNEIKEGVVFVDFFAEWCGPCKMMAPVVEEIEQEISSVKFIKVNVDDAEEIAMRYGIMSIPTFILYKDGQLSKKMVGGHSKQEVIDFINN